MWRLLFDGAPADRVPGTGGAERWTSTEAAGQAKEIVVARLAVSRTQL